MAGKESDTLRFLEINLYANEVKNRDILRFVPALRKRLGQSLRLTCPRA
jgi:hypothetical protein